MKVHFATPLLMIGLLLTGSACGNKSETAPNQTQTENTDATSQILKLNAYHYTDTVGSGKQRYVYDIVRKAVDSIAVVEDENGDRYADNLITLNVLNGSGSVFFKHTFSKKDFGKHLSSDFRKHGILEGMAFDRMIDGKPRFAASVGMQYSDMSMPFLVTLHADGSFTITRDEVLDNIVETLDTTELY